MKHKKYYNTTVKTEVHVAGSPWKGIIFKYELLIGLDFKLREIIKKRFIMSCDKVCV